MTDAPMKFLFESDGRRWYFAEPGHFARPGVYFWNGTTNVHVDDALAGQKAEATQAAAGGEHKTRVPLVRVYFKRPGFSGEDCVLIRADDKAENHIRPELIIRAEPTGESIIALDTPSPAQSPEQPAQAEPMSDERIAKIARAFSDRISEACGVDPIDHWTHYSDEAKADVLFVLAEAGIKEKP